MNYIKIASLIIILTLFSMTVFTLTNVFFKNKTELEQIKKHIDYEKAIVYQTEKTLNGVFVKYYFMTNNRRIDGEKYYSGSRVYNYRLPFNTLVIFNKQDPMVNRIMITKKDTEALEIPDSIKLQAVEWSR